MPDIIQRLKSAYISNPAEALNMLPELFQRYDEGLIKVLPCNTVYEIHEDQDCGSLDLFYWISSRPIELKDIPLIGKTVFLTREAAKKALESEP